MEWRGDFTMFRVLSLSLLGGILSSATWAAPPVDLSDFDGSQRSVRRQVKTLTDKDLIFTDNVISPEKTLRGLVLFKKDAIGRTHPDTTKGKGVMRFRPDYRARFLRVSQDKNWIAVELLNGRKRAWVPADSLEILDEEYKNNLGGKLPGGRDE